MTATLPSVVAPFVDGAYRVRFAESEADLDAVLRLRFEVFNLELREGLASAYATGRDEDAFDAICHHLLVEEIESERTIGTYRLQTAEMAERGFYSASEFDLSPLAPILGESIELGRACIAREHRNRRVLFLLWRGLATYLAANDKRYLFGCCSLTSQDPATGWRMLHDLEPHLHPEFRVDVQRDFRAPFVMPRAEPVPIPTLFQTYLRYGAKVCGGPAIDREFGTIDYLVLLDVAAMDERSRRLFFD